MWNFAQKVKTSAYFDTKRVIKALYTTSQRQHSVGSEWGLLVLPFPKHATFLHQLPFFPPPCFEILNAPLLSRLVLGDNNVTMDTKWMKDEGKKRTREVQRFEQKTKCAPKLCWTSHMVLLVATGWLVWGDKINIAFNTARWLLLRPRAKILKKNVDLLSFDSVTKHLESVWRLTHASRARDPSQSSSRLYSISWIAGSAWTRIRPLCVSTMSSVT